MIQEHWLARLNPWHSLFGKFFIWFWITLVLIISATTFVVQHYSTPYRMIAADDSYDRILRRQARRIVSFYARFGPDAIHQIQRINEREQIQIIMIDDDFRMIGNPRPNRKVIPMMTEMLESEKPVIGLFATEVWLGPVHLQVNDRHYFLLLKGVPFPEGQALPPRLENRWIVAALALILSCFLSAGLAWSFSRPITKMRRAARSLAQGRLDTRLGDEIVLRHDEFGALGRDFDDMAARLENLIHAQQRLLSNVSHELRSPLTRIQVALGIAHLKAPDVMTSTLDRIEKESNQLEQMIAQVLKLSRLENQMQHVQMVALDLSQLINKIVDDANFEAQASNRSVVLNAQHTLTVQGESQLLESAIENVVRNAIRYTPENTAIDVNTFDQDNQVIVTVRDKGAGASEEIIAHLFEPFYRAVQNEGNGAGLGLSIAYQVVKRHHGEISARNHPEGGLEVCFKFPGIPLIDP